MSDYKASIVCVIFDEKYEFEDVLLIGMANNEDRAKALLMDDIFRVMKDFGVNKCEIEESRSEYDKPITIVHTNNDHRHYYCLFDKKEKDG